MRSIKESFHRIYNSILSFSRDTVNNFNDRMAEGDFGMAALTLAVPLSVVVLVVLAVALIVKLVTENLPKIIAAGFLAAAAYSALSKLFQAEEPTPPHKPTPEDYQAVQATVKPALATVAPALGLAPIYEHTDITADPEEQILPWGKVWRMKFKVLKQNATTPIDKDLCRSVIQAQLKSVLSRENPSGFANVSYGHNGTFVPILQLDEIIIGDAFVYLFVAIACKEYFQQKSDWENRKNVLPIAANTDDEDF